jgi:hypothetical protein
MSFDLLIVQEKSNKKPKKGDVFVLNPGQGVFCFGKVVKTNVVSRDSFVNGMNLVFIYDYFSQTDKMPEDLESLEILSVQVINNQLWRKGFAKNIAVSEVTERDTNTDYGFWDTVNQVYVDLSGSPMDHIPKYKGIYGLGSYGSIGKEIHKVLTGREQA